MDSRSSSDRDRDQGGGVQGDEEVLDVRRRGRGRGEDDDGAPTWSEVVQKSGDNHNNQIMDKSAVFLDYDCCGGGGNDGDDAMDNAEPEDDQLPPNPMLNHLIVANVLRWLPVQHLLKTRLVCKLWTHEAAKLLRQSATVTLISQPQDNQMLRFLDTMTTATTSCRGQEEGDDDDEAGDLDRDRDLDCDRGGRSTSTTIPYSQFQVRYDDKLPTEPAILYREQDFFRLLGVNLTHLTLDFLEEVDANLSASLLRDLFLCNVPNLIFLAIDLPATTTCDPALLAPPNSSSSPDGGDTAAGKTRKQFTYLFPRLQTLLIVDFLEDQNRADLRVEERDRYSPGFLKDLLTTAPRLNKFSFLTRSPLLMSRVVTSLGCLALGNLSHLHLDGVVSNSDLRTLASHPLPLQSLRLRCLKGDVTKGTLEALLAAQRKTLTQLCLGDRCDFEENEDDDPATTRRIALQLPVMERLEVLTLLRRCLLTAGRFGKIRFASAPYSSRILPALTKLAFDSDFPEAFQHLEDFFPPFAVADPELPESGYVQAHVPHPPCLTVKELNFSCVIALENVNLVQVIANYFPAVEKVRMSKVTREFASVIAEHMVSILELFIYFPDLEEGGKPSLMSLCIQLQVRNCRVIRVLRNPRNFLIYTIVILSPSMGNLTRLEKVVIETRSLRSRVQDATVLATFTHLRMLHFNRKIGVKYREALSRTLPFVRLEESLFSDAYK